MSAALKVRAEQKPAAKPEPKILFQTFFKSAGPRTYAAQIKEAGNGNHFLVLTEGKRDDKTEEVRKTRLFVFSEDFKLFFHLLQDAAQFIRDNPVPADVRRRRERFWAKKQNGTPTPVPENRIAPPPAPKRPALRGARPVPRR